MEIKLGFEKYGDEIMVVALNEDGEKYYCGNLLTFKSNGTIEMCSGVNDELGFELDENEQIKVTFESNTPF